MMRTAVFVLAVVLAAGCPRANQAAPVAPGAAAPADVTAAAKAVIEQWRQASEVRSIEALARLYAHDADVTVVSEGIAATGWSAIEALLTDRLGHASAVHVRLKDLRVGPLAATAAVAIASMTREVSDGATTVTETGTVTLVLRKDADAWLIASEHFSYKR